MMVSVERNGSERVRSSLRRRRAGLAAGSALLLLAIKAIMRCHTIRVPTLNYDKTIQMPGIRLPSLSSTPFRSSRSWGRVLRIFSILSPSHACHEFAFDSWKPGNRGYDRGRGKGESEFFFFFGNFRLNFSFFRFYNNVVRRLK